MQNREVIFRDLGVMDYKSCWDYQELLFNQTITEKIANRSRQPEEQIPTKNWLLFVEHPHVYTLGKSGDEKNLLVSGEELRAKQAEFYRINRGGDITYHGPGQLVAYPVLDLDNFFTDIHKYLRLLEEAVIRTAAEYGIIAGRSNGETGVWLDADDPLKARKICAMGVRCSRWVTMHGLALNVSSDLSYFGNIVPCGISNKQVTSIAKEIPVVPTMESVKESLRKNFCLLFGAALQAQPAGAV